MKSSLSIFADVFEKEKLMDKFQSFKSQSLYQAKFERLLRVPHNRQDIVLESEWGGTLGSRNFLLVVNDRNNKLLIFVTKQNLRYPCPTDTIYSMWMAFWYEFREYFY